MRCAPGLKYPNRDGATEKIAYASTQDRTTNIQQVCGYVAVVITYWCGIEARKLCLDEVED